METINICGIIVFTRIKRKLLSFTENIFNKIRHQEVIIMNESIKNMLERRSIRAYKKDLVPQETLDVILEAGEYSPSGMGQQSTLMVVTQNPELVAKLSKMNADVMGSKADPFYGAPTVIIVFSDSKMGTCVENGSLVMGNLMNAAHALGVDSCWIHRAREVFDSEEGKELKKQWGVRMNILVSATVFWDTVTANIRQQNLVKKAL